MRRTITAALGLLIVLTALEARAAQVPYDEMAAAARRYLAVFTTPKDIEKLRKNLFNSVETKRQDQGLSEDEALSQIMLDWAFDNEGKIKKKEKSAVIRASYYFTVFVDRRLPFPGVIEERLTQEDCRKIIDHLNQEAATGGKKK